jgi:hypothetical protein
LRNLYGGLTEKIWDASTGDVAFDLYHRYKVELMFVISFHCKKFIYLIAFNN